MNANYTPSSSVLDITSLPHAIKRFTNASVDLAEASVGLGVAIYDTLSSPQAIATYKAVWSLTKASLSLAGQIAHLVALNALLGLLALLDWLDDSHQEIQTAFKAAKATASQLPTKAIAVYLGSKQKWANVYKRLAQGVPSLPQAYQVAKAIIRR